MSDREQKLDAILRKRGLAWAVDMFTPSSQAVARYLSSLDALETFVEERGLGKTSFSPESLDQLVSVSPYKADAFLQALVSIRTTPMLCAAWRILQGMQIKSLEMHYAQLSDFSLHVVLCSPSDETEEYKSNDINDAVFVRHLGKAKVENKPLFDGFYALRQT